eukprot:6188585-Pleurochrysis_carterae.AAC.10
MEVTFDSNYYRYSRSTSRVVRGPIRSSRPYLLKSHTPELASTGGAGAGAGAGRTCAVAPDRWRSQAVSAVRANGYPRT